MELTPAERVQLNAAIVNAARTGQPLAGELQSLYDRAAQFEAAKQQQLGSLTIPELGISEAGGLFFR